MNSAKEIAGTLTWTHAIEHEAAQVQLIREHRVSGEQDVAFGARPFILCGMPIRRLPKGTLSYRRRNGKFFLEIVGHPEWGVPFGQDRLVLLYLATNAIRHKSATVWFRRGAEILLEWGMPTNGIYYDRLMLAFQRVFGSTMFFGSSEDHRETKVWECSRIHLRPKIKRWRKGIQHTDLRAAEMSGSECENFTDRFSAARANSLLESGADIMSKSAKVSRATKASKGSVSAVPCIWKASVARHR